MEFPTTNLYELESRVFTDHWSIPYKREESLGKCLIASTCLARHGKNVFAIDEVFILSVLFWKLILVAGNLHVSSPFFFVCLFVSFFGGRGKVCHSERNS